MPIYVEGVLGLNTEDTAELSRLYANFLTDTTMGFAQTNEEVRKQFADIKKIQSELNQGFTRMHYLYPKLEIPKIYLLVSGFNASIFAYDDIIAVGADMYLEQITNTITKWCIITKRCQWIRSFWQGMC